LHCEDHDHGVKLLMCVARHNPDPVAITAMVRAGADVNDRDGDGRTALMYAAPAQLESRRDAWLLLAAEANASPLVVSALLEAGADPGRRALTASATAHLTVTLQAAVGAVLDTANCAVFRARVTRALDAGCSTPRPHALAPAPSPAYKHEREDTW
jgi:ankyrin repeat protein